MYIVETKSVLTQAMVQTFNSSYPQADFANLFVSIEYPMEQVNYPGIWVGFEPLGTIDRGGINNSMGYALLDSGGNPLNISRWRAQGYATFTLGALTSLQRDRLFDEVLRVLAFNQESASKSFRSLVEQNPILAMNMNFDTISIRGMTENPGTPWGTNEIIYEATLALETVIEFFSPNQNASLYPLSKVLITANGPVTLSETLT